MPTISSSTLHPELAELVRRRAHRVEPHRARAGLAELRPVGLGDQRVRHRERLHAEPAADQVDAGDDVAPLIGRAGLQLDLVVLVEVAEVVRLQRA